MQGINPASGPQDQRIHFFSISLGDPRTGNIEGKLLTWQLHGPDSTADQQQPGHTVQPSKDDWFEQSLSSQHWDKKILPDFLPQFLFRLYNSLLLTKGLWVKCYTWAYRQTSGPIDLSKFNTCGISVLLMAKCSQVSWKKLESVVCHLNKTCFLQPGLYATFLKVL